jgi:hypothetical protein
MTVHFRRFRIHTEDCTVEDPPPYCTGPTDSAEPPLTTETLIALAHPHRQGIPYETGEQWLDRLPERLRDLSDLILGGRLNAGDVADAVAALIDSLEHAPGDARKVH